MKRKELKVNAILDSDLEKILQNTNQYEKLINGEVHCVNCNSIISIQNIGIIVPKDNNGERFIEFYCERIDCTQNYYRSNG